MTLRILLTFLLPVLTLHAADYFDETKSTTLFAFDDVSIPHIQNLRVEMRTPTRHPKNPVVPRGAPGTPDAQGVQFYGSVIREGGKYRLWYVAFDDDKENPVASTRWRPAYAESDDGVDWIKPNLGLVEYHGTKDNNLVLIDPVLGFVNLKVLLDPSDPDPQRRYKMSAHVYFRDKRRLGTLAPFASPDGLRWKLLKEAESVKAELKNDALVLPAVHFEPSGGLYQWEGQFYVSGQNAMNAPNPYHGRIARSYRSPDFVNWSSTSSVAFVREPQHTLLGPGRSLEGEQTHEGLSVCNRGNVLLGIFGQWHGAKEWRDVTIDLGFAVSNDGVHFREPAHEWTFIKRGDDGAWDQGGLIQAQGFENIGNQTFIYYGSWDPRQWKQEPLRGGIGIAVLPRDRFGDLVVEEAGKGSGDYQLPEIVSEFVTSDVSIKEGKPPRFYVNADGLGPDAALRIELLDHLEKPISGHSGKHAAEVRQNGFQTPIIWTSHSATAEWPQRIRLRVVFEGKRNTDIRFNALYVVRK